MWFIDWLLNCGRWAKWFRMIFANKRHFVYGLVFAKKNSDNGKGKEIVLLISNINWRIKAHSLPKNNEFVNWNSNNEVKRRNM